MMREHFFVNLMMLLQVGAVLSYGFKGNFGLSIYWLSCLAINFLVTYVFNK